MTINTRPRATSLARALSISALLGSSLLGTTALVSPLLAQTAATAEAKADTIEQRISSLHDKLQITAAEEANWTSVAQTMRDNSTAMQKLVAEKKAQSPATMTALDDMTNYQTFAQAHVDGLKKLNMAFKTLYDAMPDTQKKVADETFRTFGRDNAKHG